jgi:hypothetical protein
MVKNFYEWLIEVSNDENYVSSFSAGFGNLSREEQLEAFAWLKRAYISGVENAGGEYLESENYEEAVTTESSPSTPEKRNNFNTVLRKKTRFQPQFKKLTRNCELA